MLNNQSIFKCSINRRRIADKKDPVLFSLKWKTTKQDTPLPSQVAGVPGFASAKSLMVRYKTSLKTWPTVSMKNLSFCSYLDKFEPYLHRKRRPYKFLLWTKIYIHFELNLECKRDTRLQLTFWVKKKDGGFYYLCQRSGMFWIILLYIVHISIYYYHLRWRKRLCLWSVRLSINLFIFFVFDNECTQRYYRIVVIVYIWVAWSIGISQLFGGDLGWLARWWFRSGWWCRVKVQVYSGWWRKTVNIF